MAAERNTHATGQLSVTSDHAPDVTVNFNFSLVSARAALLQLEHNTYRRAEYRAERIYVDFEPYLQYVRPTFCRSPRKWVPTPFQSRASQSADSLANFDKDRVIQHVRSTSRYPWREL